jgi:hypothetical protein
LRDISHYSYALVHSYVQASSSFLKLPILEEFGTDVRSGSNETCLDKKLND